MKTIKYALFFIIISFSAAFTQPIPSADKIPADLQNKLNLSDAQREKIETILAYKKDNLDRIRNKMMTIMDDLRDSAGYISNESEKEILKVLNKEQTEEFKAETGRHNQFAMMPPSRMIYNGFPQDMIGPILFRHGMHSQNPRLPGLREQDDYNQDCIDNQDTASDANFRNSNSQDDDDDIDLLQDLDIFDLLNNL